MAEVIGIFAGIAQLTAQVTQGIIKLKGYWDGVKDAPREITSIIHDVELINCILCDLGKEYSHGRLPASAFNNDLLSHSLTACRVGAQELKDLVETLTFLSLHKTRFLKQRASLNVVLKQDQIKRYKSRLKRATSILSLAHQSYTRALLQIQLETLSSRLPEPSFANKPTNTDEVTSTPEVTRYWRNSTFLDFLFALLVVAVLIITSNNSSQLQFGWILLIICIAAPGFNTKFSSPLKDLLNFTSNDQANMLQSLAILNANYDTCLLGSIKLSKKRSGTCKSYGQHFDGKSRELTIAQYRAPAWSGYRTWELNCYTTDQGWMCELATYNIISSKAEQFLYARSGSLSKLQNMLASKRASLSDQTEVGDNLLAIAAKNGHIDLCRWLLQNGARTSHNRFGSVLKQVLYYGGWLSFHKGTKLLELVRILYEHEENDVFDDCENDARSRCCFYGRKEVLVRLLTQGREYMHTPDDYAQLAINVARNTDHNAPGLITAVLSHVDLPTALRSKNANNITLLHRVASRLGGSFAYDVQRSERFTKYLDDGIDLSQYGSAKECISRDGWRSFLREMNLKDEDVHTISDRDLTPLLTGFSTLIKIWSGSSAKLLERLLLFIQIWLSDLQETGIDVLEYGKEEMRLHGSGLVCKEFRRHQRRVENAAISVVTTTKITDDAYGTLRLIAVQPSQCLDGWRLWWSEPTDEFVGEFWNMCELARRTPGAWVQEADL